MDGLTRSAFGPCITSLWLPTRFFKWSPMFFFCFLFSKFFSFFLLLARNSIYVSFFLLQRHSRPLVQKTSISGCIGGVGSKVRVKLIEREAFSSDLFCFF